MPAVAIVCPKSSAAHALRIDVSGPKATVTDGAKSTVIPWNAPAFTRALIDAGYAIDAAEIDESIGAIEGVSGPEGDAHAGPAARARGREGRFFSPRRVGQALFAQRREDAWNALRPCVVLEATVGSHAWGLADEASDVDHRGVFALPFSWTQGLVAPPDDLVSADGSATYWARGA